MPGSIVIDKTHTDHDLLDLISKINRRLLRYNITQHPGDYPTQELAFLRQEQEFLLESFYERLLKVGDSGAQATSPETQ